MRTYGSCLNAIHFSTEAVLNRISFSSAERLIASPSSLASAQPSFCFIFRPSGSASAERPDRIRLRLYARAPRLSEHADPTNKPCVPSCCKTHDRAQRVPQKCSKHAGARHVRSYSQNVPDAQARADYRCCEPKGPQRRDDVASSRENPQVARPVQAQKVQAVGI